MTLTPYLELTKPEIALVVALSSAGGFLLAPAEFFGWGRLLLLLLGITLASGGAGALNHWVERDHDAGMRRTRGRPLPSGRLTPSAALVCGIGLAAVGTGVLTLFVNPLTGGLTLLTVLLYVFVYTPLKRRTHWNTLVGTVPGALPALGGWTAATGSSAGAASRSSPSSPPGRWRTSCRSPGCTARTTGRGAS